MSKIGSLHTGAARALCAVWDRILPLLSGTDATVLLRQMMQVGAPEEVFSQLAAAGWPLLPSRAREAVERPERRPSFMRVQSGDKLACLFSLRVRLVQTDRGRL